MIVQQQNSDNRILQVGGQAVIEGVMMRSPVRVATAVRRNDGSVTIRKEENIPFTVRNPSWNIPIIRGTIALVEMMSIGIRTLNFSADMAMEDAEEAERKKAEAKGKTYKPKRKSGGGSVLASALTLLIAFGIALILFFITPLYAATALFDVEQHALGFNLVAGGIRVAILLGYLYVISRLKDVDRLFQYHGAEHKAVFTFERGLDLTVENARNQSRFHPRCGTSFVLQVALIAIICFAILDWLLILALGELTLFIRLITHIPLIPLVAGVSYEGLKLTARYRNSVAGRAFVAPGFWLQRITTREPDDSQIEVALAALRAALKQDEETIDSAKPLEATV
jgi:uncharacterized protein YqhQ